jgi:hypothetical protein
VALRGQIMSKEKEETRHPQESKLLTESISQGFAVITAERSPLKVPLKKRKEEAKQTLYLDRI